MIYLKQGVAATHMAGPFLDSGNGYTPKTALTIAQADIRLSKAGAAFAQSHNVAGATHNENGYYRIPLDTTDTDTVGTLVLNIMMAGALPVWQTFFVLPPANYELLMASGDNLSDYIMDIRTATGLEPGGIEFVYTLLDEDSNPIADADVWVTTDEDGLNIIQTGYTDAFGIVTFWVDAGTYYVWRSKAGVNFVNPDIESVS